MKVALIPVEVLSRRHKGRLARLRKPRIPPTSRSGSSAFLVDAVSGAPLFGKTNWGLTFADNGEITEATYGSSAIGIGASSLFGYLAGYSSELSIDAQLLKAQMLPNSETQRLTLENTDLQAAITNATLKQQYQYF